MSDAKIDEKIASLIFLFVLIMGSFFSYEIGISSFELSTGIVMIATPLLVGLGLYILIGQFLAVTTLSPGFPKLSRVFSKRNSPVTRNEVLSILGFVCGLILSNIVWYVLGSFGAELGYRFIMTLVAFAAGLAGVPFSYLYISYELHVRKKQKETPSLTSLDLQSSGLTEFSFHDVQNLDRLNRINLCINELSTIDLSPLEGSSRLVELILHSNRLEIIDLSPLASCPNLEYLDLAANNLKTIDLTPLASCVNLTALNLGGNPTSEIGLSPLSECSDLKILTIDDMKLTEVNLHPLSSCRDLEFLKLNDNDLEFVDVTPLFECEKLDLLEIDRIKLTTTLNREVEDWPEGVRKHSKRINLF